jgi:5,10-methenyltetrahydromethanopterin hydrogenase
MDKDIFKKISYYDIIDKNFNMNHLLDNDYMRNIYYDKNSNTNTNTYINNDDLNKALLIGINYSNTKNELRGCINDVKNIKNLLMNFYNFKEENILILTDDNTDKKLLPTHDNIINGIKWLMIDSKPHSNLVLHYSGHGDQKFDYNGDEEDGKDEVIIPSDYNKKGEIRDDTMKNIIDLIPDGAKLMAIYDCCHSGTIIDLKYNFMYYKDDKYDKNYNIKISDRYKESQNKILVLSGCKDNQTSADTYEKNQN